MPSYRFTPEARDDIKNILDYTLKEWGKTQANKYVNDLEILAENLTQTRNIGKSHDVLQKGLLSFPYKSHALYYLREKNGIILVRVLHKRMRPEKHF